MATPQFGAGRPSEYSIDQVNQWMRSQPWWQTIRGAPGSKLTDAKKKAILRQAQANGVRVDEGDMEVDPAGNFNPKGHKLRNTLIVAGIAGATLATMGAAGVFAGGAGAAGAGGGAGAGAGAGAGLGGAAAIPAAAGGTLVPTIAPGLAGTLSAGSMIPTAAGVAGAGGALGTASALGPIVNPSLAGAIPAASGGAVVPTIAPGLAGELSAGSMIPGTAGAAGAGGAFDAAGNFIGESNVQNLASGTPWWQRMLGVADRVGQAAGDWEEGRRAQRQDESLAAYRQNLANEARFRSMLASRDLALKAPELRANASIRGDRLANAQPIHIARPANIPDLAVSGGFSPANWSENTRALGRQMSANALAGSGTDELTPPPLTSSPEPSRLDSFLNTATLMSSAIPYTRRQGRRVPRPGDPDYVPTQNT